MDTLVCNQVDMHTYAYLYTLKACRSFSFDVCREARDVSGQGGSDQNLKSLVCHGKGELGCQYLNRSFTWIVPKYKKT